MTTAHIEERILAEKVRLFYRQGRVGGYGNIIVAGIVAVLTFWEQLPWFSLLPFAAVVGSQTLRLLNVRRYERAHDSRTTEQWAQATVRNSLANGAAWGLMAALTFPWASTELKLVMIIASTGMTAAAVATLAAMRTAFLAYLVPLLGPVFFATALTFPRYAFAISGLLLLYFLVMLGTSRSQSEAVGQSFRLSVANEELLANLTAAKQQAEDARARAEAASHAKSEFLARMSHEIRTPLNGILGVNELLLSSTLEGDERRFVETSYQSGQALLSVINDVLDFSKIEAGKVALEPAPFALERLLEELMAAFGITCERKGLRLSYTLDPVVAPEVTGDAARLRQVLTNLIGNAIKFTPAGEVRLEVRSTAAGLEFAVQDSGLGVDAAARARIFESFEQADSSISRRFGGTGLGLAISRQLVALMGGTLALDSEPGRGSRFHFTLALPAVTGAAASPRFSGGAGRVAHVQLDDARETETIARWLTAGGFVVAAPDAATTPALRVVGHDDDETPSVPTVRLTPATSVAAPGAAPALARVARPLRRSAFEAAVTKLFDPKPAPRTLEAGTSWNGAKILLVDDDAVNRTIGSALLGRLGCQPDVVAGGREALTALRQQRYQLVLMDCEMPEVDGLTVTREFRLAEAKGEHTPIVALTAYATEEQRQLCLAAGMDEMVTKPLSLLELRACLTRWIHAAG